MKSLIFDMDGTLGNFYQIQNWLEYLKQENTFPYETAEPIYDMEALSNLLLKLKNQGWKIIVTSWLAKNSSKEYDQKVRIAKKQWLTKYRFPYDEIHLVKYGTTKADCTRKNGGYQILVDDNPQVRAGWRLGATIDANRNIIPELTKLVK